MAILYSLLALLSFQIQVRDAFSNVAPGCLEECELDHGTVRAAVVKVTGFLDVCEVHLRHGVEIPPLIVVVAIHFNGSGGATAVKEILSKVSTPSETVLCKVCCQFVSSLHGRGNK